VERRIVPARERVHVRVVVADADPVDEEEKDPPPRFLPNDLDLLRANPLSPHELDASRREAMRPWIEPELISLLTPRMAVARGGNRWKS